ncbi:ankyrin [Dothidotthia symphoricarpi CBS 119687]|uniref:Ankyrin n=1 Tax=Dothidotthia symphoricarpi CBS 119687 TaxID=1392245 RepID=A0A6A6ANK4_9PLEO|nr:ankyrin [Dothidotthia symphoricarpi CBS 119687]KAF2133116.1 ankyrin [Dothidotthia symphoricarpi CBS 119687]
MRRTPLSWAARYGHEGTVKLLLESRKVDVNSKDRDGGTPLWWATRYGHEGVVQALLGTGKVQADSKDQDGLTPLSQAVKNRHNVVAELLRDHISKDRSRSILGRLIKSTIG